MSVTVLAEGERQGVGERQGFHISKDFEERQGLGISEDLKFSSFPPTLSENLLRERGAYQVILRQIGTIVLDKFH